MPVYCYELPNGGVIEKVFPVGKAPRVVFHNRVKARRSYAAERKGVPSTKGWPLVCYASGVHPDQAQDLRDLFNAKGVPTEVTTGGDPVYRDPLHRRKALKVRGMVDRSSFL